MGGGRDKDEKEQCPPIFSQGCYGPQVQKEQRVNFSVINTFDLWGLREIWAKPENPEVKEADILIGNNLGLRGNWVPFKFS